MVGCAYTSATRLIASGSPAKHTTFTDGGTPRTRISSAIAVGTVFTNVTSSAAGNEGNDSAFSATISFPPELNGKKSSNTERSKQMLVPSSTPARSSGP
jgi:hypothetical protein